MTIATLITIHGLLKAEQYKCKVARDRASRLYSDAEDSDADISERRELYDRLEAARQQLYSISNAVDDFESHEWR